ncbi:MAG TPA: SpoIIE family protein phosphatase [Pseudomonadales bacterium]|nr:SpoIIE family protein phosphatase [Pseudomonadales bacterium]
MIDKEHQSNRQIERSLEPLGLSCLRFVAAPPQTLGFDARSVHLLWINGLECLDLGLQWLRRLRTNHQGNYIYTLLSVDQPSQFNALNLEAVDELDQVLASPAQAHQIESVGFAAIRLAQLSKKYLNLKAELPGYKQTLERDLFLLQQLQLSTMPRDKQIVGDTQVRLFCKPKTFLSGDQAGVFELEQGNLGFYLIDVVGHGMPAAVRAMGFSRLFAGAPHESVAYREPTIPGASPVLRSSAEVMSVLNQVYQITDEDQSYVCAIYGIFNRKSRKLDVCVAGMPLPYVVDPQGRITPIGQNDLPLGLVEGHMYGGATRTLAPNESIFMASDGVLEVSDQAGELLGIDGVLNLLKHCANQRYDNLPSCLLNSIEAWAGRRGDDLFDDDATMLELNFDPPLTSISDSFRTPPKTFAASGMINPLSPAVVSYANQVYGAGLDDIQFSTPAIKKILIIDDGSDKASGLIHSLGGLGHSVQCVDHGYFYTVEDPVFHGVDLVFIFASERYLRAAKWIQLFVDAGLECSPFVVVVHDIGMLKNAGTLSDLGADFFLSFPPDFQSLKSCLRFAARKNGIVRAINMKSKQMDSLRTELLSDIEAVARMQLRTLPKPLEEFKQLKLDWVYRPAQFVSGDFLGVTKITGPLVGFFSIDATGQGVLASIKGWAVARLLTGVVRKHEQSELMNLHSVHGLKGLRSPAAVLAALNERILAMPQVYRMQCTVAYGMMNCLTGDGVLAIAGHPQPVITQPDGSSAAIGHVGPGIGFEQNASYIDVAFTLRPGDRLHLFSDGLLHDMDPNADLEYQWSEVARHCGKGARLALGDAKLQWEAKLNRRRLGGRKDVSLLMLELGQALPIYSRDVKLTELFDLYLPLLDKLVPPSSYVHAARVFESRYSESSLVQMVQNIRDWFSTVPNSLLDQADRTALLIYELAWNIRRQRRDDSKDLKLQVVVLQLPEHMAVLINDDGKGLTDDVLPGKSGLSREYLELTTPDVIAALGLEMACQMVDELRYQSGEGFNSMAAVFKYQ